MTDGERKMDSIKEIRDMVESALAEARKKKPAKKPAVPVQPNGYTFAEEFDFSKPLGPDNHYAMQGAANFGPLTGQAPPVPNRFGDGSVPSKKVREMAERDPWGFLAECMGPSEEEMKAAGPWGQAMAALPSFGEDAPVPIGSVEPEEKDEAHIGFDKLKAKLSHQKGVKNPGGLAASIGRQKYGDKGMAKKAAAGKKKG